MKVKHPKGVIKYPKQRLRRATLSTPIGRTFKTTHPRFAFSLINLRPATTAIFQSAPNNKQQAHPPSSETFLIKAANKNSYAKYAFTK
jgi:hypothetical protein